MENFVEFNKYTPPKHRVRHQEMLLIVSYWYSKGYNGSDIIRMYGVSHPTITRYRTFLRDLNKSSWEKMVAQYNLVEENNLEIYKKNE